MKKNIYAGVHTHIQRHTHIVLNVVGKAPIKK